MPTRLEIGSSSLRQEYLEALKKAYRNRRLVLFLGAGVSFPYGIPTWKDLVTDILINRSDNRFQHFFPSYRGALASWMTDNFDFSPTLLARVIRYQIDNHGYITDEKQQAHEYKRIVREALYNSYKPNVQGETALSKIVEIVKVNEGINRAFPAIVTFNFDDLLERMLKAEGVNNKPVYKNSRATDTALPIIHVNGYLPRNGNSLDSDLIFTEDEFNKLTFSQLHWAVSSLVSYLRDYTVLFVGLSMTDPNLRRLLDGTCINKGKPAHYLIRKDYKLTGQELSEARWAVEAKAQEYRLRTGEEEAKGEPMLTDAIEKMLRQAHKYDRRLFKDMGVGVLWTNRHYQE
jgi:hypothetical protein